MNIDLKTKLIDEYKKINSKKSETAIKYYFVFNKVHVNLYFDNFDIENPCLTLILLYGSDYYTTPLNINLLGKQKEFLKEVPNAILNEIVNSDKKLDSFFYEVKKHIMTEYPKPANYSKDNIFSNKFGNNKNADKTDFLPFLFCIRHLKMTDKTLHNLAETMSIEIEKLRSLQKKGLTLVRTADSKKRKKLTIILKEENIIL